MRVIVTGASGALGAFVLETLARRGDSVVALSGTTEGERSGFTLRPIDLSRSEQVFKTFDEASPVLVIHLAAITSSAECLRNREQAFASNVVATDHIAGWCGANGCRLVFASTDLVFSGDKAPYREDDPPDPWLFYGQLKRQGEMRVLQVPDALVARLPLMYGRSRCGRPGFFDAALADLAAGKPRAFFDDEYRTPLDYATAAEALVGLTAIGATGIVHVAGAERVSRFDLMRRVANGSRLDATLVLANQRSDAPGPEPRPADLSLETERLMTVLPGLRRPTIEEAMA